MNPHPSLSLPERVPRSSTQDVPERALHVLHYTPARVESHDYTGTDIHYQNLHYPDADELAWLHFVGITDEATLRAFLTPYGIHELVLEDILNRRQRPKIEDYGDYVFIAARVFEYKNSKLNTDQVYLLIGKQFVMTFQQRPLGLFSTIRGYLEKNRFDIRARGIDFLAYTFLDRLVDDYFLVLDHYNTRVESLDKQLFAADNDELLVSIHKLKRDAMRLRRALLPQREVLHQLVRGDFPLFGKDAHVYLRDVYDHSQQLIESLDGARDMVVSMMDVHLSYQSNRLNQQMRVLTVITILFMPLTVITGIYGMNFDHMPELHWRYGYFMVLGLMATIIISLLVYFHRRRWL